MLQLLLLALSLLVITLSLSPNWFHQLLNPHCAHCKEDKEEDKVCDTCEFLKGEVARLQIENRMLLDKLITKPEEKIIEQVEEVKPVHVGRRYVPFAVKRQELERESRAEAKLLAERKKTENDIKELEKELDIAESNRTGTVE